MITPKLEPVVEVLLVPRSQIDLLAAAIVELQAHLDRLVALKRRERREQP